MIRITRITLTLRLFWAKLTGDLDTALRLHMEIIEMDFSKMDATIAQIAASRAADKQALDAANVALEAAQAIAADAQAQLDQRTAAIAAAVGLDPSAGAGDTAASAATDTGTAAAATDTGTTAHIGA